MPSLPFSRIPCSVATTMSLRSARPSKSRTSRHPLRAGGWRRRTRRRRALRRPRATIFSTSASFFTRATASTLSRGKAAREAMRWPERPALAMAVRSDRLRLLGGEEQGAPLDLRLPARLRGLPGDQDVVGELGVVPAKNARRSLRTASGSNPFTLLARMASLTAAGRAAFRLPCPCAGTAPPSACPADTVTRASPFTDGGDGDRSQGGRAAQWPRAASPRSPRRAGGTRRRSPASARGRGFRPRSGAGAAGSPGTKESRQVRRVAGAATLDGMIAEGDHVAPVGAPAEETGDVGLHVGARPREARRRRGSRPARAAGRGTSLPKTLLPSLPCLPGFTRATMAPLADEAGVRAPSGRSQRSFTDSSSPRRSRSAPSRAGTEAPAFFRTFFSVLIRSSRRRNPRGAAPWTAPCCATAASRSGMGATRRARRSRACAGCGAVPAAATKLTGSVFFRARVRNALSMASASMPDADLLLREHRP